MERPPEYAGNNSVEIALNQLAAWCWKYRILPSSAANFTGDGILVGGGSGLAGGASYPFQPIPVPQLPGETVENAAFSIAVDAGHVVNIDGTAFRPSNIRAQIELPADTEDILVYLDLTLDPDTSSILSGTIEFTDEASIPTTPTGTTGTSTGPIKAYKQLFKINTTAAGVDFGTVAEHSRTNYQLIRYAYESTCSNTSYAIAFLAS